MVNLPALMGILAVTALLTLGVSESANVNIIVVIKLAVVDGLHRASGLLLSSIPPTGAR
jgi:hypothetical protein